MLTHMRTQNDKNMLKYGVFIRRFFSRFAILRSLLLYRSSQLKCPELLLFFCPSGLSKSPKTKKCFTVFSPCTIPNNSHYYFVCFGSSQYHLLVLPSCAGVDPAAHIIISCASALFVTVWSSGKPCTCTCTPCHYHYH